MTAPPDPRPETIRQALAHYFVPGEHHARPHLEGLAALDSLAADLAQRERELCDEKMENGQFQRAYEDARADLAAAEARLTSAQEAVASALTSLATGPGRDGYAYAVLSEWLADTTEQDTQP